VLSFRLPSVPVNVNLKVPWFTFIAVDNMTVKFTLWFNMSVVGLTAQVELGGPPVQASDTFPVSPLSEVSVTVYEAECPEEMVCVAGDAWIVEPPTD
jgi:hypothetical protein